MASFTHWRARSVMWYLAIAESTAGFSPARILSMEGRWSSGAPIRLHGADGRLLAIGKVSWGSDDPADAARVDLHIGVAAWRDEPHLRNPEVLGDAGDRPEVRGQPGPDEDDCRRGHGGNY